jgi:hypothetical protein
VNLYECRDADQIGRRDILALARPHKALPDIGFFRITGVALVALAMLAGAIVVCMTLIQS